MKSRQRFPTWLRREIPSSSTLAVHETLEEFRVHTVCESALCPNRMECFSRGTATFMILGDVCTRRCGFCAVPAGRPDVVEEDEPERVALAAHRLGLRHVVVTSVARDDMEDEGAHHFYETVRAIQRFLPVATVEVLTPDFHARRDLIERVCDASPTVFNHNLETVERLSAKVRPQGRYHRSLEVLRCVKAYRPDIVTKSGLMLGLGERSDEVIEALTDLRAVGCEMVTIGQYLKPREGKLEIEEFVPPQVFSFLEQEALKIGFQEVFAGPYVRSSYHAGEAFERVAKNGIVR